MAPKYKQQHESSTAMNDDTTKIISDSDQIDQELQTADDVDVEEDEEDVLAMAMAEKTNALLRGKSVDFDRTFVPRISNQMAAPEVVPEADTEHADGEERSSPTTTAISSRPGAFSMAQRHASDGDVTSADSVVSTGEEESVELDDNKVILVPRASIVGAHTSETDLDIEDPVHREESPPIAEVIEMSSSEMVQNGNTATPKKERRSKLFRWLILLVLLTIAAALIALLVEVNKTKKQNEDNDGRGPPRGPPRDKYPYIDGDNFSGYDHDINPFEFGGNNRNNTSMKMDDSGGRRILDNRLQ
jgi:hypothetical protein